MIQYHCRVSLISEITLCNDKCPPSGKFSIVLFGMRGGSQKQFIQKSKGMSGCSEKKKSKITWTMFDVSAIYQTVLVQQYNLHIL